MKSSYQDVRRTLLSLVLAVGLVSPVLAGAKQPYVEGELTFAFLDLEGRTVRSSDPEFQGKVLLIDLWATWCPPCLGEIPTFIDLQERLGERGLVVVGIAFESEDEEEESRRERLRTFIEQQGINYLVLDGQAPRDSAEALPGLKNVQGFPVEILIDRNGDVADVRNGYKYTKRWARKLERELVELLDAPRGRGSNTSRSERTAAVRKAPRQEDDSMADKINEIPLEKRWELATNGLTGAYIAISNGHQRWGDGAAESLNPDFKFKLTRNMVRGDACCEWVVERKK